MKNDLDIFTSKKAMKRERGRLIAIDGRTMHVHDLRMKYGETDSVVRYWMGLHDVTPVKCSCLRGKSNMPDVIAMLQSGWKTTAIAAELGISKQRVFQLKRKAMERGVLGL